MVAAAARARRGRQTVDDPIEVVLLAGRLGLDDDGWPLAPLLDRLEQRGILPRVLCLSRGAGPGQIPGSWRCRRSATAGSGPSSSAGSAGRPGSSSPPAPRASTTRLPRWRSHWPSEWRLPYLQTVDDFGAIERGVRLSRRWFRGLVATSRELADELVSGLRSPPIGSA